MELQTTPEGTPLPDAKGSSFFTYDRIFDENSTTQEVYAGVARDLVHSVVRGMNSTIFAYGQTSSGKTFTMQGGGTEDSPGIVQMATRDLFNLMDATPDRVFLMRVSYLEIYQEDIKDLLRPDVAKLQVGLVCRCCLMRYLSGVLRCSPCHGSPDLTWKLHTALYTKELTEWHTLVNRATWNTIEDAGSLTVTSIPFPSTYILGAYIPPEIRCG